jgi:hypothetical protein
MLQAPCCKRHGQPEFNVIQSLTYNCRCHTHASFMPISCRLMHTSDLAPSQGKPSNGQYQASVGICMNFNKLQGNDYMSTTTQCATKYNQPMVAKLFNAMDFIGISNYPSVGARLW